MLQREHSAFLLTLIKVPFAISTFVLSNFLRGLSTQVLGYNLDIMRQSACLVLNPITVYSYGFLFNYTTVDQASDSMTALT